MGDVVKTIEICGLIGEEPQHCRRVAALIDTGATQTVISPALAKALGGRTIEQRSYVEGRPIDQQFAIVDLKAKGCHPNVVVIAVDESLTRRAGKDPDGNRLHVILGHDYLQRERGALRYAGRKSEVACQTAPLRSSGRRPRRK